MARPSPDTPMSGAHAADIATEVEEMVTHLPPVMTEHGDPRVEALFETATEVPDKWGKAFVDFGARNEAAWKD